MSATTQRTPAEIDNLKAQWLADGSWDIWETPGFEAHAAELRAFADRVEARRERADFEALSNDMRVWCCNAAVARLLRNLTTNVAALREQNALLLDRVATLEFQAQRRAR